MKKLILIIFILFSSNAFALSFGSDSTLIKIRTGDRGENEFTYVDISKLPIVYDADKNEAHVGYHFSKKDHTGHYTLVFLPLKTFSFDTEGQFKKWIKSVKSSFKCLTIAGIVKCD